MNKVLCIIVTYNRLSLLQRCIGYLEKQTEKSFDILVINNGCEDGTKEWLRSQKELLHIDQYPNVGCAGGIYLGMEYAYNHKYEWMWLMDDDGIPDTNQLQNLLIGAKNLDAHYVNSLVCDIDDKEHLSFGLISNGKLITSREEAQLEDTIPNAINPWNGTLIHRYVMEKIGLVKKEMMFWGEEEEYFFRARQKGIIAYTVTNAIHYHPKPKCPSRNIIPFVKWKSVSYPPSNRRNIFYRNLGYNSRYGESKIRYLLRYLLSFIFRLDLIGAFNFLKYYLRGVNDNFEE